MMYLAALLGWAPSCAAHGGTILDEELRVPERPKEFPDRALVDAMCGVVGRATAEVAGALAAGALPGVRVAERPVAEAGERTDLGRYRVEAGIPSVDALRIASSGDRVTGVFLEFERAWFWDVNRRLAAVTGGSFGPLDAVPTAGYRTRKMTYGDRIIRVFAPFGRSGAPAAFGCEARP